MRDDRTAGVLCDVLLTLAFVELYTILSNESGVEQPSETRVKNASIRAPLFGVIQSVYLSLLCISAL